MGEAAISTSIITIACVVCTAMVVSVVYPAVSRTVSSFVLSSENLCERIETSIDIIAESNDTSFIYVWVKNTGSSTITISSLKHTDILFGNADSFRLIPYDADISSAGSWNCTIENDNGDGNWDAGETLRIMINQTPSPGDYYVKIVLSNAVSDEDVFSI